MFPNVRLVILAVFASIMGISFALGLFAEFRVSHDSVVRESNVSAPLQLGSNDAAPLAVVNTAATFSIRLPATAPRLGTLAATERGAETEIAKPSTAAPPAAEPATPPASSASAPATAPLIALAPEPSTPPASSASAPATAPLIAPASEPAAPASANPSEPGKSVALPPQRRARHLQRPRSFARRDSLYPSNQPIYQWTYQSGLQSPHPVQRRRIIKRVRPARNNVGEKTAPQSTAAAVSTPNPPVK